MALHFEPEEFAARRQAVDQACRAAGLDGLLLFRQESMYWLSGYDSFGFCFFQCLVVMAGGPLVLLTRAPDLRQARHTSNIADIRVWVDREGQNPAEELRRLLTELGCDGARLGVEWAAHGLTAASGQALQAALQDAHELVDASLLVSGLRLVKSPAEMGYLRRAAQLADEALDAALESAGPNAFEGDILAAMQGRVFAGGGDYPSNNFIIGSGRDALLCRYFSGRRRLSAEDQLTLEFAGVYRQYHAAMMRTVLIGSPSATHRAMHAACVEAMEACIQALRPGRPLGEVFDAHARVLDEAGYREHRLNACGYSQGATYAPSWMDWPMLYAGNPLSARPAMVFFVHIILMDSDRGRAMTLGQTLRVTATGSESLSRHDLGLLSA